MKKIILLYIGILLSFTSMQAQQDIFIRANINPEENNITIKQKVTFTNTSNVTLEHIYFSDWNHSSSDKNSPLSERFAEEYKAKLHFAKDEERGVTTIQDIQFNNHSLKFIRENTDIIKVNLIESLAPNETVNLVLNYQLQLPNSKFTRFGIDKKKNIALKEWFILPSKLINGKWEYYSNKDLDDLYIPNSNFKIQLNYPKKYVLATDFDIENTFTNDSINTSNLIGVNKTNSELHLTLQRDFTEYSTDKLTFVSNIEGKEINIGLKAVIHDKIATFLTERIGEYPYKKMILSDQSYRNNPVYGLNQLPNFIRPYPDGFQYEIKILKASINNFIKNTINTNPRKDYWFNDGLETYLMYQYISEYYPNMKLLGGLSRIWGIKYYEIAKKKFNEQYEYTNQYMARINLNQPINTQRDSLLKFNEQIANKNRAGIGLVYLKDYLNDKTVDESIKEFYQKNKLKDLESKDFLNLVQKKTSKNIGWFSKNYINSNLTIDYTIIKANTVNNTIELTLKNKTNNPVPVAIYQLIDNKVISKEYVDGFTGVKTVSIVSRQPDKVILNYEGIVPEINLRDNTKTIKPHLLNKPLKFSFIKDSEAPKHNQIFYTPQLGFNLYDGISPGIRFSNKAILKKPFTYSIRPTYGMRSKKLVGSVNLLYTQYLKNKDLFKIDYGLHYQTFHYQVDLRYQKFNPYIIFSFRDKDDLRDNFSQDLLFRNVTVQQDQQQGIETDPNYNVFNVKHWISSKNLLEYYSIGSDLQFAENFGKISTNLEYRKTFTNNRQLNLRLFAGAFLYNNTNSDYFSFALDRPTDYLFDYAYYGRSESTGIYSQQIIIAEGGFKSRLETPFANKWMTTLNVNTNIWKYIFAYGDTGIVRNNNQNHFVYDSGVQINLVPDYFELFFPVYSNLGWEIGQPKYQEKIRFKIILTPKILIGLFTRKWH